MTSVKLEQAKPGDIDEIMDIDDDAATLYASAGLDLDWPRDHPMVQAERARWFEAASAGRVFFAVVDRDVRVGFAVLGRVDGLPYLDQLSVRPKWMQRGIGAALLEEAKAWAERSGHVELWLTTYAHLPWNLAFYAKRGFVRVAEADCGCELRAILSDQRRWLPDPEQRVAMRLRVSRD